MEPERAALADDAVDPLESNLALLARGPDARVSPELFTAYAAAAAPNSLRASGAMC